jgi:hypothetical protein
MCGFFLRRNEERRKEKRGLKTSKVVKSLLFAFMLIVSTIFASAAISLAQPPSTPADLWVNPPELTVSVGSTFSVDVVVNSSTPVSFFDVFLHFDPSAMNGLGGGGGGGGGAYPPFTTMSYTVDNTHGTIEVVGEYTQGIEGNNTKLAYIPLICIAWISVPLDLSGSQIWDPAGGPIVPIYHFGFVTQTWPFKPQYVDYAPSGVPDFSQKQIGPPQLGIGLWQNPVTGKWSWCGPTAVANSLWWMDSRFETSTTPPPTINDTFPLVQSYNPAVWDDHDPKNVPWLIANLSQYMDTDGLRTGTVHNGTEVHDMATGIQNYILAHGVQDKFTSTLIAKPTFETITTEVTRCEDTILLLGFWQQQLPSGNWTRVGGHFVTVPGVDKSNSKIYFCDPFTDNAELTGQGTVIPPPPHNHPAPPDPVHNNATFVSYDAYSVMAGPSPSPGGQFGINYNLTQYYDLYTDVQEQNCPHEFQSVQGNYNLSLPVFTEVEYAVFISPSPPPMYWKPSYPDYAPSGMPDFDENQNAFTTQPGQFTWCVPVAVANSLWWLDSKYESINFASPVPPPTKSDHFNLVNSSNPQVWDDHDSQNIFGLVANLAVLMDTDNLTSHDGHMGTRLTDIQSGIQKYLKQQGVDSLFEVHNSSFPTFRWIDNETEVCQDVELCLEFWQWTPSGWIQPTFSEASLNHGHCVTCAGSNSTTSQVAVSDPYQDAYEAGLVPGRSPMPHGYPHNSAVHNDAQYVSQDIYTASLFNFSQLPVAPPPGYPSTAYELQGYMQTIPGTDPSYHAFIRLAVATSPVGIHDVAVTNLTSAKTVIGQGCCGNLTVTVQNQGNFTENFNVTAYANATTITTITNITLASGISTTITFTWNTTDFAKGNYTVSAVADTVSGETNTANNNFTDGIVKVAIVGDVNADGKVDMKDISLAAKAFGTRPGDGRWNPNADVTGGPAAGVPDGKVDMKDISFVAKRFGQHDP